MQAPKEINENICQEIAETLNRRMAERVDSSKKTTNGQYIRYVEMEYKQTIWNYRQEDFVRPQKFPTLVLIIFFVGQIFEDFNCMATARHYSSFNIGKCVQPKCIVF